MSIALSIAMLIAGYAFVSTLKTKDQLEKKLFESLASSYLIQFDNEEYLNEEEKAKNAGSIQ